MVLEAGIDIETLIGSMARKYHSPLVPSHRCPFYYNGTIPSVLFLRSWPSGKSWLMSLLSTWDGLVWHDLTNVRAFSVSRLLDVPEEISKTLKRPHLVLVRTRYQVPTKSGRSFSLCRRSVYSLFTCLWSGARNSPQK